MKFTGANLEMVRLGVVLAIDELHNQIATCPSVIEHADAIEQIEQDKAQFASLLTRIDAALAKEAGK